MNNSTGKRIANFIFDYKVPILFLALSVGGILVSGQSLNFLFLELLARFGRDTFLVIALIIPVVTGMGLNFSIVVGAMAAQIAIFFVTHWLQTLIPTCPAPLAFLLCVLVCTPIAAFFGWLAGKLFNKMKGAEMIGGLILGYFADGLYQFFFLFVIGGIIPVVNKTLVLATGIGVKNSVDLATSKKFTGLKYSVDNIIKIPLVDCLKYLFAAVVLYGIVLFILQKTKGKKYISAKYWFLLVVCAIFCSVSFYPPFIEFAKILRIPIVTYLLIGGLCLFTEWLLKTRLGQNMRAVGQNRVVANSAGINVDRTRIIAIIISTVLASYGQLIYIQNLGVFTTYGAHTNVALYSIAALLVGGASVYKATVKQAIVGVLLFHTLFIVSPLAGQTLMNDAMIGEYFRVFICYGVIAMSLAMHAWKQKKAKKVMNTDDITPVLPSDTTVEGE
ncbi:MAG: ABC transporter permease [Flexilinea sp.]